MGENPSKKLKLSFRSLESLTRVEDYPGNDDGDDCKEKCKVTAAKTTKNHTKNSKFSLDISLEEDEKLLDDSGIDLQFYQEMGEEKNFEIRRIRGSLAVSKTEEPRRFENADLKTPPGGGNHPNSKHSYCRGEMPETNETDKDCRERLSQGLPMDVVEAKTDPISDASKDGVLKKTPDKSLFKKVQEKLLYECSLTPKKVKKKCLEHKMDVHL